MKTFARHRTLDEITALCEERGFPIDTHAYENHASDWVRLHFAHDGQGWEILYCPFNGRFLGRHGPANAIFTESSAKLDSEPWYQALLDFLYISKPEVA